MHSVIRLRSGKYIDLLDPKETQFTFLDICAGLSKSCRFGGQCNTFYSVAEHCILCTEQGKEDGLGHECLKAILMHDATEAFLGDCVKPLKNAMPIYSEIEKRMESVIASKFNLDFETYNDDIKKIDIEMLIAEKTKLFIPDDRIWYNEGSVRKIRFRPFNYSYGQADFYFKQMAETLQINTSI